MGCATSSPKEQTDFNRSDHFKYYDKKGKDLPYKVSNDGKRIKLNTNEEFGGRYAKRGSIYGAQVIDSEHGGIYKWRIKIHTLTDSVKEFSELGDMENLIIGIDEAKHDSVGSCFVENKQTKHYAFSSLGYKYGPDGMIENPDYQKYVAGNITGVLQNGYDHAYRFESNQEIVIQFDCTDVEKPKLSLSQHSSTIGNTDDIHWELDDFKQSEFGYCLAIYLRWDGDEVEIVHYNQKWPKM